jgi:hypothetical protein
MANTLKAGTVANFGGSLAEAIYQAMQSEWQAVKGQPLSEDDPGREDRRILFCAIAQGVLQYLSDNAPEFPTDNQKDTASGHSHKAVFTYSKDGS